MTFAHPWRLLLLTAVALLAVAWALLRRRRRAHLTRIARATVPLGLAPSRREQVQTGLAVLGLALCAVALARPRYGERETTVYTRGRNVMIVVDVSRSMLATDLHPNRLERARADLRDLLGDLHGDRAGLIAFRRGAAMICPLTDDLRFLRMALEGLTIDSAPRGETDIASGIRAALDALKPFPADHNAILLISDGEDLRGEALAAADAAAAQGIPIFTVGIGNPHGATIPLGDDRWLKHDGEKVSSRLDAQTLRKIAARTGGAYIPLEVAGTGQVTLGTLYRRHLRDVAAQALREESERRLAERFQWPLVPAVLCLLAAGLLSAGRPARRRAATLASALLWLCTSATVRAGDAPAAPAPDPHPPAEPGTGNDRPTDAGLPAAVDDRSTRDSPGGRELARKAQAALRAGRHAEAADGFLAAADAPGLSAQARRDFRFNAGLALLQAGRPEQAATVLASLEADPDAPGALRELLGAARFRAAATPPTPTPTPLDAAARDQPEPEEDPEAPAQRRLRWLEGAAEAFQEALIRRQTTAARGRRNLAAATADIPTLREQIRLEKTLERLGERSTDALLSELFRTQREGTLEAADAVQSAAPDLIERLEAVAAQQRDAADLWLALTPRLLQALDETALEEPRRTTLRNRLLRAREQMLSAANDLADLDPQGLESLGRSEAETLEWLTLIAPPPVLIEAAEAAQQDALEPHEAVSAHAGRGAVERQRDAQALLRHFQSRFPDWARALQEAGEPGIDPEAQAEIERLAAAALDLQARIVSRAADRGRLTGPDLAHAREALDLIERIRALMPEPPAEPRPPDTPPPPDTEPGPEDSPEPPPADPSQPDDEPSPPDDAESPTPEEDDTDADGTEDPQEAEDARTQSLDRDELERLLDRALRREREREEALRRARRTLPPLLDERDW